MPCGTKAEDILADLPTEGNFVCISKFGKGKNALYNAVFERAVWKVIWIIYKVPAVLLNAYF